MSRQNPVVSVKFSIFLAESFAAPKAGRLRTEAKHRAARAYSTIVNASVVVADLPEVASLSVKRSW